MTDESNDDLPNNSPRSDLSRARVIEPNMNFPHSVQLRVKWIIDGRPVLATHEILADQFFGRGSYGAPLSGDSVVSLIERLRRNGPPRVQRIQR